MANNKITIRESNLTTPIRGASSSDVVYIPGISGIDTSPKNIATYITSEKQFKDLFGSTPYVLTGIDTQSTYLTVSDTSAAFLKENDYDRAYLYAIQLLREGLSIYYEYIVQTEEEVKEERGGAEVLIPTSTTVSKINYFYSQLKTAYERLIDKNEYTIKYLTSGGYPLADVTGADAIYKAMAHVAATRGDCVALIDHAYDTSMELNAAELTSGLANIVDTVGDALSDDAKYATMFTPWATYAVAASDKMEPMPASFAYLRCLASAIKTAPNFLAIAGVTRGRVHGIQTIELDTLLTSVIAEDFQPKQPTSEELQYSVNCITNIRPYGYTIWGNRTLAKVDGGTTADNFLNTRNMMSDIKKIAYSTAKALMFEQDSNVLWLRFKSGVSGVLEALKTGFGIKDYSIIRTAVDNNGNTFTRGTMGAIIRVYPLYAIEYFDIEIQVTEDDVTVEG